MPISKPNSVDEYIQIRPDQVATYLRQLRAIIKSVVPDADEVISYGLPSYKYHGMLLSFWAAKNHYALYGRTGTLTTKLQDQLAWYDISKWTIRFGYDKPIPTELISMIVQTRVQENLSKKP
jgi:uncharacterized protein YdhG (YjbR/CyaY superfamily)